MHAHNKKLNPQYAIFKLEMHENGFAARSLSQTP